MKIFIKKKKEKRNTLASISKCFNFKVITINCKKKYCKAETAIYLVNTD